MEQKLEKQEEKKITRKEALKRMGYIILAFTLVPILSKIAKAETIFAEGASGGFLRLEATEAVLGPAGDIELGDSTLRTMKPNTNVKMDLGNSSNAFNDAHINGDLVLGAPSELTISGGEITITKSFHTVDTESDAASDDLDTINGGQAGQLLVFRAIHSNRTVVAKDSTGNLLLAGDFSMDNEQDTLTLMRGNLDFWIELSRSSNAA